MLPSLCFLRNILAYNTVNLLQTEAKLSNAKHSEVLGWCLHAKMSVEEAIEEVKLKRKRLKKVAFLTPAQLISSVQSSSTAL